MRYTASLSPLFAFPPPSCSLGTSCRAMDSLAAFCFRCSQVCCCFHVSLSAPFGWRASRGLASIAHACLFHAFDQAEGFIQGHACSAGCLATRPPKPMDAPFALSDRLFTRYSGEATFCAVLEEYPALRDVPYDCQGTGSLPTDCKSYHVHLFWTPSRCNFSLSW